MPQDYITLNALASELNQIIGNARIDKVSQPESDEITFALRADNKNYLLAVSVNPNFPRLHLTSNKKFNPYAAPSFCMLMRKYLIGANIIKIGTYMNDRIIRFDIVSRNELRDTLNLSFFVELMGRYSNVILTDEELTVIDSLRHISPENGRAVLPNLKYAPPENFKIPCTDTDSVKRLLQSTDKAPVDALMTGVAGLSRQTAEEIIKRAKADEAEAIVESLKDFLEPINSGLFKPCVLIEKGSVKDYFLTTYRSIYGEFNPTETLNDAADRYFTEKDCRERMREASRGLVNSVKNAVKRAEKSLAYSEERLLEAEGANRYREYGDMILANIYLLKRGASELKCQDFFSGGEVIIPLDITLGPQQNAQKYYKKFSKLSRGRSINEKQIEELKAQLNYFQSVTSELNIASTVEDIESIKEELISSGIVHMPQKAKKDNRIKQEFRIQIKDNFKIYVGRNNLENERITFVVAGNSDIFLHVRQAHGSHVIIVTKGRKVPDLVLLRGAELAAYYSEFRNSGKADVDYTERKYVKKHPSGNKGMVLYTDFSTLRVIPKGLEQTE